LIVEEIDSGIMNFILVKNNISLIISDNKIILPLPSELINEKSGLFLSKIYSDKQIKIIVEFSSHEIVNHIDECDFIAKYYNYKNFDNFGLKKLPIQYNMDLINYLSSEPIVSNCEITSLNRIFSSNYWLYQSNPIDSYNPTTNNRYRLKFDNFIRGICFTFREVETQKTIKTKIFKELKLIINGHDYSGICYSFENIKYNMLNCSKFNISNSYYYFDLDNFLNIDLIDNFIIVFARINETDFDKFGLDKTKKYEIELWGLGANTLLYLDDKLIKIN
jgi:hypothetical protein